MTTSSAGLDSELAEISHRSGIPVGVFNLVMGRGSVIGNALVQHAGVHAISFTRSSGVGRAIAIECATTRKRWRPPTTPSST